MENKQKPSLLLLTPDHQSYGANDFEEYQSRKGNTLFQPEFLTWPMHFTEIKEMPPEYVSFHRNALQALTEIDPFLAVISLRVDTEKRILTHSHRTWGTIFLDGMKVLQFSHDTRHDNVPFTSLAEWPELHSLNSRDQKWKSIIETLQGWSVSAWKDFFKNKINGRAIFLQGKANKIREEARSLETSAASILLALK